MGKTFKSFQSLGEHFEQEKKISYEMYLTDTKLNIIIENKISFLKEAAKYNALDGQKIKDMGNREFLNTFPFASEEDKNKLKNLKNTEFSLAWFKENNTIYTSKEGYKEKIEMITGLLSGKYLQSYLNNLIPYSFIICARIKLTSPYFSRDDDEFYLIQNPCLKEKVFKVPMVRGSGWKGVIAKAFRELINEKPNRGEVIQSYLRIFGTGSDEFRKLEETIKGFVEKGKSLSQENLINYLLFELGFKLTKDDIDKLKDDNKREKFIKKKFWSEIERNSHKKLPTYLTTHKGRTIFYPTYFDILSLEIINPHSRKTRAGTNPIHYEVVPKDSEGIFQIIYIPFDGVLRKNEALKMEVERDIKFLTQAIEKVQDIGIGAKEKLGWGRFELVNKRFCINRKVEPKDINGWEHCEVNDEQ